MKFSTLKWGFEDQQIAKNEASVTKKIFLEQI